MADSALGKARAFFSLVKFPHTLFALPFALLAAVIAAGGLPGGRVLFWILAAMVGARSAAMAFNRIIDRKIDATNPRTAAREIPSGVVTVLAAWIFCLGSVALFEVAAFKLNTLAFALSPVALLVIFGYSFTKRFTSCSHFVLGLALAIAPVGAWIAVTGRMAAVAVVLGGAVLFWVAGFDILYSLQDESFDRAKGLFSVPVLVGQRKAMLAAALCHAAALALFYAVFLLAHGGVWLGIGVVVSGLFLVRQHVLVKPGDLSRIDAAFFTANGWLSVAFLAFGCLDVLAR